MRVRAVKRSGRSVGALALLTAGGVALAACGGTSTSSATATTAAKTAVERSHTLHIAFLGEISQPPDPDIYYAGQGENIIDNVYQTLVQYKTDSAKPEIVPDLATSWKVSPDGLQYTFTLRKHVLFHDGTAFTCSAIEPDFQRRLAVDQGPAYMVQDVASVTCPSPYQAVITLKKPENDFLDLLASEYGPKMISPTALSEHAGSDHAEAWLASHDAGTGPYTMVKANPSTGYVLKYYPKYWGPKPYYTTIDISVVPSITTQELELEHGSLDVIEHSLPTRTIASFEHNASLRVYKMPTEQGEMFYLNPHAPGLSSPAVRKAIEDAVNKSAIVQTVYPDGAATVSHQIYPFGQLPSGLGLEHTGYDPSLLRKLAHQLSGVTIDIAYQSGFPNQEELANVIQTELSADGLHVQVAPMPGSQIYGLAGKVTSTPSILVYDPWPDAANPYTWAHIAYEPSGGLSFVSCPSTTASAMLTQALRATSSATADELYSKAGEAFAALHCWDWMANKDDVMVAQRWLTGVRHAHSVMAPFTLQFAELRPTSGS